MRVLGARLLLRVRAVAAVGGVGGVTTRRVVVVVDGDDCGKRHQREKKIKVFPFPVVVVYVVDA